MSLRSINNQQILKQNFATKGTEFKSTYEVKREEQIKRFQSLLESFREKHQEEFNNNSEIQTKYGNICRKMGVEVMRSKKPSLGSTLFGVTERYYYELTIQIIEECYKRRESNGGIVEMNHLLEIINEKRKDKTTVNDISKAIKEASCLGNGLKIITVNDKNYVMNVPFEFAEDQTFLLTLLDRKQYFFEKDLVKLGWSEERVQAACKGLLNVGIIWIDKQYIDEETNELTNAYWISFSVFN